MTMITKTDGPADDASYNTREEDNYEKKLPAHEEKPAGIAANGDDLKTPGQQSTSCCWLKSGDIEVMEQPKIKNCVSVPVVDNSLKKRVALTGFHDIGSWFVQRPFKRSRTQPDDAVNSITSSYKSLIPSQCSTPSELDSRSFSNATHTSSITTSLDNKLREKVANASGVTVGSHHKVRAFSKKSSDDMQGQGRISMLTDVSPSNNNNKAFENVRVSLRKPTQGMRCRFTEDKSKTGRAPPKKQRNCKASVLAGHPLNDKPSNNTGEFDTDQEDLLVAASSIHNAREHACSKPFWKKMESIFAPVAADDLQFLNRQLNQTGNQMLSDVCEAVGVSTKRISGEIGKLDQESARCTDLGGLKPVKILNLVPSLFQRVLCALIDEDESKESNNSNEGTRQSINDDSHKDKGESEVESEVDFQSQKYFLLAGLPGRCSASSNTSSKGSVFGTFCNDELWQADYGLSFSTAANFPWSDQDDLNVLHSSQVNTPLMSPFNCQYQELSLDDKLVLELQSIGLNWEVMPFADGGEEWIDKEINGLQRELYKQAAKVKNNLRKIEPSIQSEQELDKRSIEESAMDQLVQLSYSRMVNVRRRRRSSRTRKVPKQVALAFVNRTLARCKQFENSGRSCFSEPYLQGIIFNKPPSEISVEPRDCNDLMTNKDNVKHKDSGFMNDNEGQELPGLIGSSHSSKANEVIRIGHPGQVHTGFSNPSGLIDIASCASSKANLTSQLAGIPHESVVKYGDKDGGDDNVNSTSPSVNNSEAKSKEKRTLSGIGMRDVAKSSPFSAIKSSDHTTSANNEPHSPPIVASQPSSGDALLDDFDLSILDDPNFLEDLGFLLDFDDEGMLDGDCDGLDVPMDNLSDIEFLF